MPSKKKAKKQVKSAKPVKEKPAPIASDVPMARILVEEKPKAPREQSAFVQEEPKTIAFEQTSKFDFTEKEKLITQLTAGGMVMSFGLSVGSVIIAPAWPQGGGLLATLGVVSCFGAFMARETVK